jgi:hypothetical protein
LNVDEVDVICVVVEEKRNEYRVSVGRVEGMRVCERLAVNVRF